MLRPEVRIEISTETGEIKIEADGYTGKQCEDATVWIEKALGCRLNQVKKPEYNRLAPVSKKLGMNQGQV